MNLSTVKIFSSNENAEYIQITDDYTPIFEIVSCRGCDKHLTTNNPVSQYQRQKIIQNTVRVASSLYTMNLGALNAYTEPLITYQMIPQNGTMYYSPPRANWNQQSDRPAPSVQQVTTNRSSVRQRPGSMSPGGTGVDIKHNSYDRFLRRLKGKTALRQGIIPANYGNPILFNRSRPVYGGKVIKTSIINSCKCKQYQDNNKLIYNSPLNAIQDAILNVTYKFNIGDYVFAKKSGLLTMLFKAQIKNIVNGVAYIEFQDKTKKIINVNDLIIYDTICNISNIIDNLNIVL